VSYPIFNRFQRENQIQTAEINIDNTQAQLKDARLVNQQTVITQLGLLRNAEAQMRVNQISVRAAEEALRVSQQRYALGAGTFVDVLTSQSQLIAARQQLINARLSYRNAKAQIEQVIGRDCPDHRSRRGNGAGALSRPSFFDPRSSSFGRARSFNRSSVFAGLPSQRFPAEMRTITRQPDSPRPSLLGRSQEIDSRETIPRSGPTHRRCRLREEAAGADCADRRRDAARHHYRRAGERRDRAIAIIE